MKKIDFERGPNTTRVFEDGYAVRKALAKLRIPYQRNQRLGCWEVPTSRSSDVIAYFEHMGGVDVVVIEVLR